MRRKSNHEILAEMKEAQLRRDLVAVVPFVVVAATCYAIAVILLQRGA
jgi:hypothetical protein